MATCWLVLSFNRSKSGHIDMRKQLCSALLALANDPGMVFFTGDLGFMALEPLRDVMKDRFINAGIAEQNMISVAAAMAKDGWKPWCYSIAPFCFARPFEQIRNDVCLHNLPVRLLGNGGGYGYGVMGPTHHAVDDYAVLLALPYMRVFVPCFNEDVSAIIELADTCEHPCYVRLGLGTLPAGECHPTYSPWRQVLYGAGPVVICVGPLGGVAWAASADLDEHSRPDLWILSELPVIMSQIPHPLLDRLNAGARLIVIEEHIAHGGAGAMLVHLLLSAGVGVHAFTNLCAAGLALGVYGSQAYLRSHCGLSPESIRQCILSTSGGAHE